KSGRFGINKVEKLSQGGEVHRLRIEQLQAAMQSSGCDSDSFDWVLAKIKASICCLIPGTLSVDP
ncbi:11089_t:CDS:2, partial [Gigaspora rosea]